MLRLWQRMGQIYGHRWVSSYGEGVDPDGSLSETAQLWRSAMGKLSMEAIKRGLAECLKRQEGWPPTLPEFLALCGRSDRPDYYSRAPMLTYSTGSKITEPDVARAYLQAIREKCGWVRASSDENKPDQPWRSDPARRAELEAELRRIEATRHV